MTDALIIGASVVLDANTAISVSAREAATEAVANAASDYDTENGYTFYAPGVIITETLYALRNQMTNGLMTAVEHAQSVQDFADLMKNVLPPPDGDRALILRADQIRQGYGASRSADALYLARAERPARTGPARLLTFDRDLPKQAARNAPAVTVHLLA